MHCSFFDFHTIIISIYICGHVCANKNLYTKGTYVCYYAVLWWNAFRMQQIMQKIQKGYYSCREKFLCVH